MELIADVLLASGALGAAFYCMLLQRKLLRFTQLENGMGGAIAVLSAQVDDLTKALNAAQIATTSSTKRLEHLNAKAEATATHLELTLSSLHDLPDPIEPESVLLHGRRLRFVRKRHAEGEAAE